MKGIILLNYDDNIKQIEEEEQNKFLRNLFIQLELPVEDLWEDGNFLSIDQRIKLRAILKNYNIQIINDLDGTLQIYIDREEIATWNKPLYFLKRDMSQLDPRKQLYLEMHISYKSVFENNLE
jgi:hypothetical protein